MSVSVNVTLTQKSYIVSKNNVKTCSKKTKGCRVKFYGTYGTTRNKQNKKTLYEHSTQYTDHELYLLKF